MNSVHPLLKNVSISFSSNDSNTWQPNQMKNWANVFGKTTQKSKLN